MKKNEIKRMIDSLPKGSINKKIINGKEYYYHRYMDNGKRKEVIVHKDEINDLRKQIDKRKKLEKEYKTNTFDNNDNHIFNTGVIIGNDLKDIAISVSSYKKRGLYKDLENYLYTNSDKVLILYGLRRTGKTTLIKQALLNMNKNDLNKAAFIQISATNTLKDINADLKYLKANDYKYIFIDEVTLMKDFISGAAIFSDIFVSLGMKIVLSGTDSLGFLFSEDEQLYDRSILLHTTFIPYKEFEEVLDIRGIDKYIEYGGTMSISGNNYNIFSNKKKADEYVNSAIAHNIQHSLALYQYGNHFRSLKNLFDNNELTNTINRIVEDINHRFTLEVLTRDFKSNDLALSSNNLRKDINNPTDILDKVNINKVTNRLKKLLEIKNINETNVFINEDVLKEINEYLHLLDIVEYIEIDDFAKNNNKTYRNIITQPGLRYAQAEYLIESLLKDETMNNLSLREKNYILDRILCEIKGRMLEDIILLETKLANKDKEVYIIHFPIGEFHMLVFNKSEASCEIYEIKHSDKIVANQYRHLIDKDKCDKVSFKYGNITNKIVLYRGKKTKVEDIEYINVEDYLKSLYL